MKPILFNTEMVRAILNGRKTVTRRLVKRIPASAWCVGCCQDYADFKWNQKMKNADIVIDKNMEVPVPYHAGDVLYVRETWSEWTGGYVYKADGNCSAYPHSFVDRWHPSIHMPKKAARIFLRVTDVRVERLQEITDGGARHEGCGDPDIIYYNAALQCEFAELWNSTIKPTDLPLYGWDANPWVWVIEFERCEKPEDISNA